MQSAFLGVYNLSIAASFLIIAVIIISLSMKKVPKFFVCILWLLVGIKLVLPISFESNISLSPNKETFPAEQIISGEGFQIESGLNIIDSTVNGYISENPGTVQRSFEFLDAVSIIWLIGMMIMLLYLVLSYIVLKRKISDAVFLEDNIYLSEKVSSPFVLGIIKPKIYMPYNLSEEDTDLILDHERAHIKRLDYLWKPIAFIILSIHFFNPLVWAAYFVFCRDIELACDESVVKNYDAEKCKKYAYTLLNTSLKGRSAAVSPIGFGAVSVEKRVKNTVSYKKPTALIIASAAVICVLCAVFFMTVPAKEKTESFFGYTYSIENKLFDSVRLSLSDTEEYAFSSKKMLFTKNNAMTAKIFGDWAKAGDFEKVKLNKAFENLIAQGQWKDGASLESIIENNDIAYKAANTGRNYYLLSQKNGDIYFAIAAYNLSESAESSAQLKKLYKMQRLNEEPENIGYIKAVSSGNGAIMQALIQRSYERVPEGYEVGNGAQINLGSVQKPSQNKDEFCELEAYAVNAFRIYTVSGDEKIYGENQYIPTKLVFGVSNYGEYKLKSYEEADTDEKINEIFPEEYRAAARKKPNLS